MCFKHPSYLNYLLTKVRINLRSFVEKGVCTLFFFLSPMSFISLLCFLHTPTTVPCNFEASSCVSQCKMKKQFLNLVVHLIY